MPRHKLIMNKTLFFFKIRAVFKKYLIWYNSILFYSILFLVNTSNSDIVLLFQAFQRQIIYTQLYGFK